MTETDQYQYHVHVKPGDIGRYVLLPGDPGRVEKIAAYLDEPHFVSANREHTVWTGKLLGEMVSVVSTGMGCPSTAIAVEELIRVGAATFIRVGTAGAIQPDMKVGDVAVVTAAIRDEGTTRQYLPIEYPAVADTVLVNALAAAAETLGIGYMLGVSHTKDNFYGEIEPDRMPIADDLKRRWKAWVAGGAVVDPSGLPAGSYRVSRGGAWASLATSCRSAHRAGVSSTGKDEVLGFRVALVSVP